MTIPEREARTGRLLILPSLILIGLLTLYPLLYTLYLSFFDVTLGGANSFTGLDNLAGLLSDRIFWRSLGITMLYTAGTTLGTTLFGVAVALLLNRPFPGRRLVLAVVLLPYAAPLISEVYSWQFFFDPVNGLFIDFLVEKTGLFPSRFNLMAEAPVLFIVLFSVWRNFPFTALLVLSRLQVIDRSLYDAAGVDGAGPWHKFLYITVPEILFITSALSLIRFIWNFSKFDEVYLLAPHLRTLPVHTYYTAFTGAMEMGLASALAVIQIIIMLLYISVYVKRVLGW